MGNIGNVTIKSKKRVDEQTSRLISHYLGIDKVSSFDEQTLILNNPEVLSKYSYYMCLKDSYDYSDVTFMFTVYKIQHNLFIAYIKHDMYYYFEAMESISDVEDKHTWFIKSLIEFHKDVLVKKRN